MRVLLVHPEDSVLEGPWAFSQWDLVIDLGWAGSSKNMDWSQKIRCPVRSLFSFADWHTDVCRIREACATANGALVDAEGIDWWELLAPLSYQQVYEFLLLQKVAHEVQTPVEMRVTRPHRLADALGKQLRVRVDPFLAPPTRVASVRFNHFTKKLRTLTSAQVVQIALDKWDSDYGVRRFFSRRPRSPAGTRVLLPSAYRNVSRMLTAYASLLPDRSFLLVTTRADGELKNLPRNVAAISLAAYTPLARNKATEREIATLTLQWETVKKKLAKEQSNLLHITGLRDGLGRHLRNGLRIRDAWRGVFEQERIDSVLCGDENNPYTRLTVLLAQHRRVHTVHCSHGALDANVLLRGVCSDVYLAKGEMEKDYLVRQCSVPSERVFVAAPSVTYPTVPGGTDGTHIVFFSEPYELYSGRTETLYQEVLPDLCAVARKHGRKVMVKLHPFESLSARSRLIERVLTDHDRILVEVTAEPVSERLLRQIWFSLTVESSVAVECAMSGIPCFLCGWFDLNLYSYGRQYARYGVAQKLNDPSDILRIPELLRSNQQRDDIPSRLWHRLATDHLDSILSGSEVIAASSPRTEAEGSSRRADP